MFKDHQGRKLRLLQGIALLLLTGVVYSLVIPLSKIAIEMESNPIGLAFWVNAFACMFCLPILFYKNNAPRLRWPHIRFFSLWGITAAIAGEVLIFWVADHLSSSIISIIIITEGIIVFSLSTLLRIEQPSLRRFCGVIIGIVGIVVIIMSVEDDTGSNHWLWILIALGIPLGYAIEDLLIDTKMPEGFSTIEGVTFSCLFSSVFLLVSALVFDDFVLLSIQPGKLELSLALVALTAVLGTYLFIQLIKLAGAVFAAQIGCVITFSGIAWSTILLGETLPILCWFALALIMVGLTLIEPKHGSDAALEENGPAPG